MADELPKGPWTAIHGCVGEGGGPASVVALPGEVAGDASVVVYGDHAPRLAAAIAAMPELMEACRLLCGPLGPGTLFEMTRRARCALTKAEGRAS